jgi:hypothetical protein
VSHLLGWRKKRKRRRPEFIFAELNLAVSRWSAREQTPDPITKVIQLRGQPSQAETCLESVRMARFNMVKRRSKRSGRVK